VKEEHKVEPSPKEEKKDVKAVDELFDEFKTKKEQIRALSAQARRRLPRVISKKEMYNSFLKVDDNFDFKIDHNALKRVIECRTDMHPIQANHHLAQLNLNPFPHRPKVKPMNVREMELQLNKKSKHSTFHTDSKLIKEFEINSLKPNGVLYSYISQEEKLQYEDYFKSTHNPLSFVDFIIKNRRATSSDGNKTSTIYGIIKFPNTHRLPKPHALLHEISPTNSEVHK